MPKRASIVKGKRVWVSGTDEVIRNLNTEIRKIRGRSRAGLAAAALHVRGESQELVPVVTGDLRASAYTDTTETPLGPVARVGYTEPYALRVHEDPVAEKRREARRGTPHPAGPVQQARVGQWKYLETALKENFGRILEIIRARAAIR